MLYTVLTPIEIDKKNNKLLMLVIAYRSGSGAEEQQRYLYLLLYI